VITDPPRADRDLRIFWTLLGAATLCAVVVSIIGLVFLVGDIEADSDTETALRTAAAITGLATGLLFAAAAIYASVRRLWGRLPTWLRIGIWVVLAIALAAALITGNAGKE